MDTGCCANKHIGCSVTECKHHAKSEPYCTLDHINVVKSDSMTNSTAQSQCCTDCASFVKDTCH